MTRWRSEECFQAWVGDPDFNVGYAQHRQHGLVDTGSEPWTFDLLEDEVPS